MTLEKIFFEDETFEIIGVINLSSMNISDDQIPFIIDKCSKKKYKKCFGLILRNNLLTSCGMKLLVQLLINSKINFKYLSFAENPNIGDQGMEYLISLLEFNKSINFLALTNTGITDQTLHLLAKTFSNFNFTFSIEKLYLSFNPLITDQSIESILIIIQSISTLQLFSLKNCNLSETIKKNLKQTVKKFKKTNFILTL